MSVRYHIKDKLTHLTPEEKRSVVVAAITGKKIPAPVATPTISIKTGKK